jgi:hypothetical protein
MSSNTLGNIDNQLNVGVIVVVGAAGDFDVLIRHANVLGIDAQILRPTMHRVYRTRGRTWP